MKDMWSISLLRDVFREFVGTTLFLFTSLSSCTPDPLHVSLAFGASVALTCVCLGGVHLNPALTLALVAGLRVSPWRAALYVGAQLLGALTACSLLLGIAPAPLRSNLGINELASGVHLYQAFSVEMAVTFQLVLSVLTVTHPKSAFLSLAPAVLGLSVTLGHLIAQIGFTGCGMNPARSFGPAVLTLNFENHWVMYACFLVRVLSGYFQTAPHHTQMCMTCCLYCSVV
uniref:Uncharacterized protein n=1 Tax=Pygocentrus nattereri TaxID=42514 RepID=A0A3B4C6I2_PYGNA